MSSPLPSFETDCCISNLEQGMRTWVKPVATPAMWGPFMICRTVTAGEKGSSGSSLGVSKNACGVPSPVESPQFDHTFLDDAHR